MNLHISKSKNSESFYIAKSYVKANGSTTSTIVRKLGTLDQLIVEHGPTRDDVLAWAKNEVKLETEKYKKEKEVYISEEDQDIGDQIINDQFGRIDEKSRREYGKRDEAKTYNLGKRKEINKKIKNVKYKKEETKSEFQKKKKTYIDQIEEQQHAIKSQIISKK